MNGAEKIKATEAYFQRLTGTETKYTRAFPGIGRGAFVDGSEDNILWEAHLVREGDKHNPDESYPTGDISSLKLITKQMQPNTREIVPVPIALTKIDYLCRQDVDAEMRIAEAIYAQDNLREIIENRGENFRVLDLLTSSNDILLRNIEGIPKLTVHLRSQNKKGKDVELPFLAYETLGKNGSEKSIVRAEALSDHHMRDVLPLIDMQIKKLNGALTTPVKVPIEL